MKILWHSTAPWVSGGYGRVCQEVVSRLQNETHHEMGVQCVASLNKGPIMWHGEVWQGEEETFETPLELDEPIPVFPSTSHKGNRHFGVREVQSNFADFGGDFYFTHFDSWMQPARDAIPDMSIPYGSYVIVDHYPCPREVTEQVANAYETVAMSRFAQKALSERGIRARYIPHGVDTEKYRPLLPDEDVPKLNFNINGEETQLDLGEEFVFGMVATNYADRKNIPNHMQAFKRFLREVDDEAILYMHMLQRSNVGFDLYRVQKELGIPDENIAWVPPNFYHDVGDVTISSWYSAMDVLLNATMGESWGLTITEAMACETPAIVSNFSSMPEQVGVDNTQHPDSYYDGGYEVGSHGVAVNPRTPIWREKVNSKQYIPNSDDIFSAMQYYYNNPSEIEDHGKKARQHVENNYTWEDHVAPAFKEMFDELEEILV